MSSPPKTVLLFGGTGPAGLAFLQCAIAASVHVTVFARNPSKIPSDVASHALVTVLPAAELTDTAALRSAVAAKPDAIVSLLGPPSRDLLRWGFLGNEGKTPVFRNAYSTIVDAMREFGVRRILVMGTPSIQDPKDGTYKARSMVVWGVWGMAYRAWWNILSIGEYFDAVGRDEEVQWTVFRIGWVIDGDFQSVTDGYVGDGRSSLGVRRSELAEWLIGQVLKDVPEWVGEKPIVSTGMKPVEENT